MPKSYSELLRDPRWQRRRLEKLETTDFSCEVCGDGESTLHVHHRRYIKGRLPWEYGDVELVTVCETCHTVEHEARETLLAAVLMALPAAICERQIAALVAGYLSIANPVNLEFPHEVSLACDDNVDTYNAGRSAGYKEMELREKTRAAH